MTSALGVSVTHKLVVTAAYIGPMLKNSDIGLFESSLFLMMLKSNTYMPLIDVSRKLPYINMMVISDNFYSQRIAHLYMWSTIGKLLDFQ